jgi:hypothetical protein
VLHHQIRDTVNGIDKAEYSGNCRTVATTAITMAPEVGGPNTWVRCPGGSIYTGHPNAHGANLSLSPIIPTPDPLKEGFSDGIACI